MTASAVRRSLSVGARVLAFAAVIATVIAVRVVTSSHAELEEAHRLRGLGEVEAAIPHYRRAAAWYAPGNPYSLEALVHLATLGRAAEEEGQPDRALAAWRAVRAAIMSSRSVYTPHTERLEEADEHIAELMSASPTASAGASAAERRARYRRLLAEDPRPHVGWGLMALCGFVAWVVSALGFANRAFDGEGRFQGRVARRWGVAFAVGLALFVVGLILA